MICTSFCPVLPVVDETVPIGPGHGDDEIMPLRKTPLPRKPSAKKRMALVEARNSLGRTQAELASDLGLSAIYIRKIEAGDKTPGRDTILKMGVYFQRPVFELFPDVFGQYEVV